MNAVDVQVLQDNAVHTKQLLAIALKHKLITQDDISRAMACTDDSDAIDLLGDLLPRSGKSDFAQIALEEVTLISFFGSTPCTIQGDCEQVEIVFEDHHGYSLVTYEGYIGWIKSKYLLRQANAFDSNEIYYYILEEILSIGKNSQVWRGKLYIDDKYVDCAIKKVSYCHVDESSLRKSIRLWKSFRHNNIVQLYQVLDVQTISGSEAWFFTELGRSIPCTELDERYIANVMMQAASGLEYLHNRGYAHMDVKVDNFVMVGDTLKIIDLNGLYNMRTRNQSDVWTTAQFLPPDIHQAIMRSDHLAPLAHKRIRQDLENIIQQCLDKCVESRITVEQLKQALKFIDREAMTIQPRNSLLESVFNTDIFTREQLLAIVTSRKPWFYSVSVQADGDVNPTLPLKMFGDYFRYFRGVKLRVIEISVWFDGRSTLQVYNLRCILSDTFRCDDIFEILKHGDIVVEGGIVTLSRMLAASFRQFGSSTDMIEYLCRIFRYKDKLYRNWICCPSHVLRSMILIDTKQVKYDRDDIIVFKGSGWTLESVYELIAEFTTTSTQYSLVQTTKFAHFIKFNSIDLQDVERLLLHTKKIRRECTTFERWYNLTVKQG